MCLDNNNPTCGQFSFHAQILMNNDILDAANGNSLTQECALDFSGLLECSYLQYMSARTSSATAINVLSHGNKSSWDVDNVQGHIYVWPSSNNFHNVQNYVACIAEFDVLLLWQSILCETCLSY